MSDDTTTVDAISTATEVQGTFLHLPLMPKHPRLRFLEDAPAGAAGDPPPVDDSPPIDDPPSEDPPIDGEESLGDPGKKALLAMKEREQKARARATGLSDELKALKAEIALKDKPAEEQERLAALAEAVKVANDKANERILRAELRTAATGKLADPTDAALYINLSEFTVSDDGEVDADALSEAVADLLTRKPHLAAGKPSRFDGAADQGAKGKEAKPGQLTQQDLESMSPEAINAARREGRLNKLLGVNQ